MFTKLMLAAALLILTLSPARADSSTSAQTVVRILSDSTNATNPCAYLQLEDASWYGFPISAAGVNYNLYEDAKFLRAQGTITVNVYYSGTVTCKWGTFAAVTSLQY